jgi:hypothetical protein
MQSVSFTALVASVFFFQGEVYFMQLYVFIKVIWVGLGYGCRGLSRCFGLGFVMGAGVYQGVLGWARLWVQGFIKVFWVGLCYGCRGLSRCFENATFGTILEIF